MYKRNSQGWAKYLGFILFDEAILQFSFIYAVFVRHGTWAYTTPQYNGLGFVLILIDAIVIILHNSMHDVITRGYSVEAAETFKHCFYVFTLTAIYFFLTKTGHTYSRIILTLTFVCYGAFGYVTRLLLKIILEKRITKKENKTSMLVVASPESAALILETLSSDHLAEYKITGVVLTEKTDLKEVGGYPVVADLENVSDYIVREWVDSVYIEASLSDKRILQLMDNCAIMAVPTHYHIPSMGSSNIKRFSEQIGGTTVLTSSINYVTPAQIIIKRMFDIVMGIVGSLAALMILAVVGPVIKKESPGPILFTQERIGQNGKHFKMYKIRSMYMDAEERKKELMAENRVKDGMMFKLDFDPRIIGNKILPDGTKKTGIGEFIRRTSLDEFPQFFCVLTGAMSTVGTRPPTLDEYSRYQYHHRARMSTKPGITGMWQVSGRSDITDFEEVVRLDTEYINNWNFGLDFKIILRTFLVLFKREGAL